MSRTARPKPTAVATSAFSAPTHAMSRPPSPGPSRNATPYTASCTALARSQLHPAAVAHPGSIASRAVAPAGSRAAPSIVSTTSQVDVEPVEGRQQRDQRDAHPGQDVRDDRRTPAPDHVDDRPGEQAGHQQRDDLGRGDRAGGGRAAGELEDQPGQHDERDAVAHARQQGARLEQEQGPPRPARRHRGGGHGSATMADVTDAITIPDDLLPADGRFGAGPSKVRVEALERARRHRHDAAWAPATARHRCRTRSAASARAWRSCSRCPRATRSCSATAAPPPSGTSRRFGLIRERSQHLTFGEFSSKFAKAVQQAPFLGDPTVITSEPGQPPRAARRSRASTPTPGRTTRPRPRSWRRYAASPGADDDALVLIDATSGAGGLPVDLAEVDAYYFAPQKCFASDGGLWFAVMSPRRARPRRGDRRERTGGSRPSSTCRPRSTTPGRTRPTTPRRSRRSS